MTGSEGFDWDYLASPQPLYRAARSDWITTGLGVRAPHDRAAWQRLRVGPFVDAVVDAGCVEERGLRSVLVEYAGTNEATQPGCGAEDDERPLSRLGVGHVRCLTFDGGGNKHRGPACGELSEFRREFCACLPRHGDARFELADGVGPVS